MEALGAKNLVTMAIFIALTTALLKIQMNRADLFKTFDKKKTPSRVEIFISHLF